jgi:hypothetical protein
MLKHILLLSAISAGVLAASPRTFHVTLAQNAVVEGHALKAGSYKVELKNDSTAVLRQGKEVIEVPAHEQTAQNKFSATEVEFTGNQMQKIDIGGTHTAIVFDANAANAGPGGSSSGAAGLR